MGRYMKNIYQYPSEDDRDDFEKLIKLNLWANHCDIIMSNEYVERNLRKMLSIRKKEPFIVCNHTGKAWSVISERDYPYNVVAFVCDNAGIDFFLELCVADFLYTNHYARIMHFHVKHIPWFISDLIEKDVYQMLNQLVEMQDKSINNLARNWQEHFKAGRWKIITRKYWTLPIGFSRMQELDPILYKMLEDTKLVIIKGDLNYRKLLEDKNLAPSTPAAEALKDFHPSNLLLVRVMKCDIVCGVPTTDVEKFEKLNENWMDCGAYGLIQFVPKPIDPCDCIGIGK